MVRTERCYRETFKVTRIINRLGGKPAVYCGGVGGESHSEFVKHCLGSKNQEIRIFFSKIRRLSGIF